MKTSYRPRRRFRPFALLLASLSLAMASTPLRAVDSDGWIELFDGHSLAGWKAAEHPEGFNVIEGTIVATGPRAHLFYVGADGQAAWDNFEFSAEVNARAGSNSGIFILTAWQDEGWPAQGFEVQVNHSQKPHGDYRENKKTGSLYGVRNTYKQLAPDDQWFRLDIKVTRPRIEIRINGTLVVDYLEPAEPLPATAPRLNRIGRGTFALQAHDPASQTAFRRLRVRPLMSATGLIEQPVLTADEGQLLALAKANFPLVDLHTHLKGDLTLDRALAVSRHTGVALGIATNGGIGFPIQNDDAALAFLDRMQGRPVFLALQAEGREWMNLFSTATRARFDYIFSDAMTFTNAAGRRLRLWIPAESDIGPDVQAFMEELTAQAVQIIATEPIDIYVNPTFLPDSIAARADELWTEARMQRIIAAAVAHGVAIELNARYRLPSERFVRLAKAAGAKFTFGSNNTSAADFGDWSYPLELQRKVGLTWQDMFVPGHAPSRAQRALQP